MFYYQCYRKHNSKIFRLGITYSCWSEIGVASTKAFTGQLLVMYILILKIAEIRKTLIEKTFWKKSIILKNYQIF